MSITTARELMRRARTASYTIWLITLSDLKTIVVPTSIFGVLGGLPSAALTVPTGDSPFTILCRLPLVVLWVWMVLLPFNIDNQRRPAAIAEDKLNRPWRPLPSGRMTPEQAVQLMLVCHVLAVSYSYVVGGLYQSLTGIVLGWAYNGLGGADTSCVVRNAINALGYVTFSQGSVLVASRSELAPRSLQWFSMLAAIIFTTVQMQDLPDREGDALRGRHTVPLVIGDRACRWTISVSVLMWSALASIFWEPLFLPSILCPAVAAVVSWRVLNRTSIQEDKQTFWIWNLWIVTVYVLPLGKGDPAL